MSLPHESLERLALPFVVLSLVTRQDISVSLFLTFNT